MGPHLPGIDARTILEASIDGIIISDGEDVVLFVNSAVERITGTSAPGWRDLRPDRGSGPLPESAVCE